MTEPKNTVIPFLFDAAREKCKVAFEGERSVWQLFREDPDRYIYSAVRKGIELPLPPEIEEGVNTSKPNLLERRKAWNKPAPAEYALPTEIRREVVARRKRYEEVRGRLAAGEVCSINDLITYNLDIRQFAQDVIENCEGPELLVAFWRLVESVTVLDPACGSGAFLFAALSILEPLYEACLELMRFFLEEWGEGGKKNHPNYYKLFTETKLHSYTGYCIIFSDRGKGEIMRPAKPLNEAQRQRLEMLLGQAKTKADFQRIQCLWLRATLKLTSAETALAVGWSQSTVKTIQSRYLREGEQVLLGKGRGGRRYSNLTWEEEDELLCSFLEKARTGGVLVVAEIKGAYERKAGKTVPKSTVYRMLARHGWRKIAPRPRHPRADPASQEEFKKTPGSGRGRSLAPSGARQNGAVDVPGRGAVRPHQRSTTMLGAARCPSCCAASDRARIHARLCRRQSS